MSAGEAGWIGPGGAVGRHILELNDRCLKAYQANPALVEEHANAERIQTDGGYGRRQVWELLQNGADEMLEAPGRVEVVLTETHLYCANQGKPVTPEGAGAILSAYRSSKRGPEIGRFGLGFKSVLGVSSTPEFYSRSGSFGFDPSFGAEQIGRVLGDVAEVPTLRLGLPLDAAATSRTDPTLDTLMTWATTVVRLPLDQGRGDWLTNDLRNFPPEFLVFSPHIAQLVLDDRVSRVRREIHLEPGEDDFEHRLIEGDHVDVWRVFAEDFKPSPTAARDGGAMANREIIRFQWAVPLRARQRIGGLWAYFPTLEEMTLSGVINAPWKLNDDRTRVIEGPFNTEILRNAVDVVLSHLDVLSSADDPANVLDILPARGREVRNWADGFLTELINEHAAVHPSIPDQDGELELPAFLTLHPAGLGRHATHLWSQAPTRPKDWAHRSIDANQTRRSRAERFLEASPGGRQADVREWLEALIPRVDLKASAWALLVAAQAVREGPTLLEEVREAGIVIDERGKRARLLDVVMPGQEAVTAPGIRLVHASLAGHPKVGPALRQLGVKQVDAELQLRALLSGRERSKSKSDWDLVWRLAGALAPESALLVLKETGWTASNLRVRVASGADVALVATLLPGDVARADQAPSVVIDVQHHHAELPLMRLLGAVASPTPGGARKDEPALQEFRRRAVKTFVASLGAARPDETLVSVACGSIAGPLTPLAVLEGESKARYTRALLQAQGSFSRCEVKHSSNRYNAVTVEHPVITAARDEGLVRTALGLLPCDACVGPALSPWAAVLPVADIPGDAATALGLAERMSDLSKSHWETAYRRVIEGGDADLAGRFYGAACLAEAQVPDRVLALVGDSADAIDVAALRVTGSTRTVSVLRRASCPVLLVPQELVEPLVDRWGVCRGDDEIASEVVAIETAPRMPLVDLFPALRIVLDDHQRAFEIAWCSDIQVETYAAGGRESETTLLHLDGTVVYVDESLDHPGLLTRLSERLGLALDAARIDKIIANRLNQEIRRQIALLRAQKSDAEKLAIVASREAIEATLPQSLVRAVEDLHGSIGHVQMARLAFAVHGVETLKVFRDAFEALGLQPPSTWAGSRQAVEFVRGLGFGRENAGFEAASRARQLEIDGPPGLNELHEYQKVVVKQIHEVIRTDPAKGRPRGMVSLPTGAGKTRVAIQALIEAMHEGALGSPVLWVAQRDELCEQAVQAWSEVWRDRGPQERLTISRLWSTNEAEPVSTGTQVVVATIAKLESGVMEKASYDWLSKATCIVIDEAHGAISPGYTRLLEWQGMDRNKERAPLLGLTATPYRGVSEEETKRLINRFGTRRLDTVAFGDAEPYRELQAMGVLSHVEHRTLPGSDIELSAREVQELKRTRLLPSSASDKLAQDPDRNRVLLESIQEHPEDWTSLLFCASVEHAQVMAGLLTQSGIPAAAVSGNTPAAARRHYVEAFRAGRIRVLTNYAVFTAGFDAPEVRAVYVARPVYSPNVYQQMIGRGLRGPLNGGSEECLIVNVEDNVLNFEDKLAFRDFEHLWEPVET